MAQHVIDERRLGHLRRQAARAHKVETQSAAIIACRPPWYKQYSIAGKNVLLLARIDEPGEANGGKLQRMPETEAQSTKGENNPNDCKQTDGSFMCRSLPLQRARTFSGCRQV